MFFFDYARCPPQLFPFTAVSTYRATTNWRLDNVKWKRIGIFVLIMTVLGGTGLYAAAERAGFTVLFNKSDTGGAGIVVDGQPYVPLKEIAGKLQAMVSWSGGSKLNVYKPNVNLVLINEKGLFGSVNKGDQFPFKVIVQVDNLQTAISALKVEITNPSGRSETVGTKTTEDNPENFWFFTKEIKYSFDKEGAYPVRVYMKQASGDDWSLVSELQIIAK